ncbi:MAG: hypothetical protein GY815_01305, partial [Gammaproteobacteria bacterium]|nr:hypothetical protein [Gammaproteobacteria bacterium]
ALCITSGEIRVFKVKAIDNLKLTVSKRQFKTNEGTSYQFLPATSLLTGKPGKMEPINSKQAGKALIEKLNLSGDQLIDLATSLELAELPKSAVNPVDINKLKDTLSEALANSEAVVSVTETNLSTPGVEGELVSEPAGNTAAVKAPANETVSVAPVVANKEAEKEQVCKL